MQKNKAIIYSTPHSGSSLLKSILGHHSKVNEIIEECMHIPNHLIEKDMLNLCKFPLWHKQINEESEYIKIFLFREPIYCLYSLDERWDSPPKDHEQLYTYEYWENYMQRWLIAKIKNKEHALTYKDIFDQERLKQLYNFLNLNWEDPYGQYERKIANQEIPKDKPNPKEHVKYRQWQINQPIVNRDNPNKIKNNPTFSKKHEGLLKKIENNIHYKQIRGDRT